MNILTAAQIVVSILLVGLVLIQQRDVGVSGLLGGGGGGTPYQTRRGFEKIVFWATIVTAVIFAGLAIVSLLYRNY